ncbi:hypothetical protein LIER_03461 [Lithospermum erythrorhizon]|uniref:RNase H type-1 domain-containing protein n=1 Tax=Lithospermum erythrorhizon TaxID=34254 RepID=A0AAV3NY02_LITER
MVTDQALKKILTKPALSGQMTTWAIELSEFTITYVPRTSIKAQVLADFLIKCTDRQPMKIDGPKEPQEPSQIPEWVATNNEAEYEAMIAGLMLVKHLGVKRVIVRGDSKLVMDQINGACGVKNDILIMYHEKAVTMAKGFDQTIFQHVPRVLNEEADRLS